MTERLVRDIAERAVREAMNTRAGPGTNGETGMGIARIGGRFGGVRWKVEDAGRARFQLAARHAARPCRCVSLVRRGNRFWFLPSHPSFAKPAA